MGEIGSRLITCTGKKTTGGEASLAVEENEDEDEQDTTAADSIDDSFSEITIDSMKVEEQELLLLPEGEDRRGTFTFLFEENDKVSYTEAMDDIAASTMNPAQPEFFEQDATLTRLFQASPSISISDSPNDPERPAFPAAEDAVASAVNEDETHKEVVERGMDGEAISAQATHDAMDEDTTAEANPAVQDFAEDNSEVLAEEPADRLDDSLEIDTAAPWSPQLSEADSADFDFDGQDEDPNDSFTEASLQLNIQREMQLEEPACTEVDATGDVGDVADQADSKTLSLSTDDTLDITSGLTLQTASSSPEPTPRKLRSPSPPPRTASGQEDRMTFAFDDDTALLKNFLSRAAASKANRAENIARRESLQNRRDSDVVRHALASPRKALEAKDPNSPSKYDNDTTLNLSQTLTLDLDSTAPLSPSRPSIPVAAKAEDADDTKAERVSRRSARARTSRLPAPSSIPAGPPKISVKRDGGDPVVLKKTDAQELGLLTRSNTRKNKQGAMAVNVRLLKLSMEARANETKSTPDSTETVVEIPGKKYVRWDSQLAYFQENTEAIADALADAESLSTPDELSMAAPAAKPTRVKVPKLDKDATPKVRKVRNLGSRNGTPGKGLLTPGSLLPDSMMADKEEQEEKQRIPKPKTSRIKVSVASTDSASPAAPIESKLPVLDIAPVGIDPAKALATKERKSRLATPRKVKLPQLSSTGLGDGKENQGKSVAAPAPKKTIPIPAAAAPAKLDMAGAATGLPRRRGRKM